MSDDVTLSEPLHELAEQLAEERGEEYDREEHEQEIRELVEAAPAPSEAFRPPEFQDGDHDGRADEQDV